MKNNQEGDWNEFAFSQPLKGKRRGFPELRPEGEDGRSKIKLPDNKNERRAKTTSRGL